ncbi:TIGR02679 domain-containing protein [Paenibacillaceae bacterium WGS1546]|uniref:TIGR02679 domain-containing protein n=1 Tax=Cohnella sp. WGS1546 TaxID=3366810 RepID=UPI00372D55AD
MTFEKSQQETSAQAYFGQPGFRRFLSGLRGKFEASGSGPRGYVALHRPTEEELETLDGFYGTYTSDRSKPVYRYSINRFERLLLASRFGMSIPELLRLLYGQEVRTRGEQRAADAASWETIVREAMASIPGLIPDRFRHTGNFRRSLHDLAAVQALSGLGETNETASEFALRRERIEEWVKGMLDERSPGVRVLRKLFAAGPDEAKRGLSAAVRALLALAETHALTGRKEAPVRLPVLAANTTGDAHALDWKHPLGRLFWWGLVACFHSRDEGGFASSAVSSDMADDEEPLAKGRSELLLSQAHLIREGYRRGGVADDDLSSQVMFFAPERHLRWEERVLTLRQVERMAEAEEKALRCSKVYAVENPSVFAILTDAAVKRYERSLMQSPARPADDLPLLVCANGQPSVAVVKLLELVLGDSAQGAPELIYSGDLDVKGLEIAQGLQQRFSQRFRPWKMDSEHYVRYAHRGMPLADSERQRLEAADIAWDSKLGGIMAAEGFKLHQELWVNELLGDWLNAFE